jgi:biotin transport system substrate-specific component
MITLADRLRPLGRRQSDVSGGSGAPGAVRSAVLSYDLPLVLGASCVIALAAQLAIQLPFSPVPITGQTLALLLLAAALGRVRAAAAALCYLAEGAAGIPVFAGGSAGAHVLAGPTGGYLVGFVPAAWLVGALAERGFDRHPATTAIAMLIGNAVVLLCGASWLAVFVGPDRAVMLGVLPFLIGDVVKAAFAAALLPLSWRALGGTREPGGPRGPAGAGGATDVRP